MSVIFISGKPGGGKSYWAFKQYVVRELIQGQRTIITNLDILPGMLNEWLQEFAPKQVRQMDIDLHSRLIILTKDQSNRFYLYRPDDYRLKDPEEEWDADKFSGKVKQHGYKRPKLDLTQCYRGTGEEEETCNPRELGGVLYIIDELHEYFNAREWMETGRSALTYLSQHRKMGDDVHLHHPIDRQRRQAVPLRRSRVPIREELQQGESRSLQIVPVVRGQTLPDARRHVWSQSLQPNHLPPR